MKHVLFDTDGVIVHSDMWSNEYSRRSGIPPEIMKPFFCNIFGDCITGKSDLKEVINPYLSNWNWTGSVEEYLEEWFRYENRVDRELIRRIQELRKAWIECHVATNQEKYRLEYLRNTMGFSNDFDSVFCSSELGYKKPQKEFYERVLQTLNTNADEVLYFDDAEENIESAKELWINVVLYRDLGDFEKALS